ncbi:MAG: iron-sulfur cluster assembly scaffold protein [Alphaproteobacteria bacterium]|nr:iron-sulfur cluster assembly scaffold protein [Alphaproteobacteria bacterium]
MLSAVYSHLILELAGNIGRLGVLKFPDASSVVSARPCGSKIIVHLCLERDVITDFAHEVQACALGKASSSLMAQTVIGAHVDELFAARESVCAMLKEGGPVPLGRWKVFECMAPVHELQGRHSSVLLTFDATLEAARKSLIRHAVPYAGHNKSRLCDHVSAE